MLLRCTNVHKSIRFHSEHLSTCSDFILLSHLFSRAGEACFQIPKWSLLEPAWLPDYSFDDLMSAFFPPFFHFEHRQPTERPAPLSNRVNIQSNLSHIRVGSKKSSEPGLSWMTEGLHPEQSHMNLRAVFSMWIYLEMWIYSVSKSDRGNYLGVQFLFQKLI